MKRAHVIDIGDPILEDLIGQLREELARRNFAFGALYVVDAETKESLILLAKGMPARYRIPLLEDLSADAEHAADYFRRLT